MKKPIIVANWKMNLGLPENEVLIKDIISGLKKNDKQLKSLDLVFCPSDIFLLEIGRILRKNVFKNLSIYLGAQNCFWEDRGSFTGETSPLFLKQLGCRYIILGHSERRGFLKEDWKMIQKKVEAVLNNDLIPVLCVGETFEERQSGARDYKIMEQVNWGLNNIHLKTNQQLIIAYEPVWVENSGQVVQPEEAEYVTRLISQKAIDLFPLPLVRNNIRFIYGGSVNHHNVARFLEQDTIDGVLVGTASLNANEFIRLCQALK